MHSVGKRLSVENPVHHPYASLKGCESELFISIICPDNFSHHWLEFIPMDASSLDFWNPLMDSKKSRLD